MKSLHLETAELVVFKVLFTPLMVSSPYVPEALFAALYPYWYGTHGFFETEYSISLRWHSDFTLPDIALLGGNFYCRPAY